MQRGDWQPLASNLSGSSIGNLILMRAVVAISLRNMINQSKVKDLST